MILQALNELAEQEHLIGDPDYEWRPISWLVRVGEGGELLSIEDVRQTPPVPEGNKKKSKPVAKRFLVPRQEGRTSGDLAFFFCDKAEYVFGIDPAGKRPAKKLSLRSDLFCQRVKQCALATQDAGAQAVSVLLVRVAGGEQPVVLPPEMGASDLIGFALSSDAESLVTNRPKVRAYWKRQRAQGSSAEAVRQRRCLVSGKLCQPVGKLPPIRRVPGGTTSGVAVVSFNASAFESYGWSGNANAPISRQASEACATALNRLLDNTPRDANGEPLPRRNIRISSDTAVCFWSPSTKGGELADALAGLLDANPEQVGNLYRSVWTGRKAELDDPSAFYALTLSGAQGRATVRDWMESTVSEVSAHLAEHFEDLSIVRGAPPPKSGTHPPQFPLRLLLQSLAVLGKDDNIPAPLAASFVKAALGGTDYPLSILARAVGRSRSEFGQDFKDDLDKWKALQRRDARAALCKAVLNRQRRRYSITRYPEIKRTMDPANDNPGYRLGALMAVLERLQGIALGDVNATVVDRYFSGASATPRVAFTRMLKNAMHHARKGESGKDARNAFLLERLIDELLSTFGSAQAARHTYPDPRIALLPASLSLEDQGNFIVGYHHMRKWLWMNDEERQKWEADNPDAPRAFQWRKKPAEQASA